MKKELDDMKESLKRCLGDDWEIHLINKQVTVKRDEEEKRKCPIPMNEPGILKKHSWIIWIVDGQGYITDLQVYEVKEDRAFTKEKIFNYVNSQLKGIAWLDMQLFSISENKFDLIDIIFKFTIQYGFKNREIAIKCMKRLATIEEFKDKINLWLL